MDLLLRGGETVGGDQLDGIRGIAMSDGRTARSVAVKSCSTKSAGSWRPGGRPTPTRTRMKSAVPVAR